MYAPEDLDRLIRLQSREYVRQIRREIGRTLRQAREERGWSVDQLAERAGLQPNKVRALEQGRRWIAKYVSPIRTALEDQTSVPVRATVEQDRDSR